MPREAELPDDLKPLVYRDGVELSHARWDSDVKELITALEPHLGTSPKPAPPRWRRHFGRASVVAAVALALLAFAYYETASPTAATGSRTNPATPASQAGTGLPPHQPRRSR